MPTGGRCVSAQSRSRRKSRVNRHRPVATEVHEVKALLEWMADNHFTFLGYRQYRLRRGRSEDVLEPLPDTGLGILRSRRGSSVEPTVLTGELRERARQPELLTTTKANSMSTVHRATYLDYVGLKTFDSAGRVTGEKRFLGLFTSAVYNRSPREIPLLRHKIDSVVAHFGLDPASHDGKAVVHVLETYPRDELFQSSVPELIRTVRGIVNLYERQRVRVFLRRDAFGRFYSALIFVPRDRYNTQVRQRMESVINQQLHATAIESQVQLSDSALARVHMIIRVPSASSTTVDADALERLMAETVRTWNDRLRAALIETRGEFEGRMLADRFANAFPAAYEEDVSIPVALEDIKQLVEVIADPDRIAMRLTADPTAAAETIHLRLFRSASPIALSQALPILENMGFVVLSEHPYRIEAPNSRPIWLQDFQMQRRDGGTVSPEALGPRFTDTFASVWTGRAESDGFNRLVVVTDDDLAPGSRPARLLQIPAADRRHVQPVVHGAGAGFERRNCQRTVAAVRSSVRSGDESAAPRVRARRACKREIDRLLDAVTASTKIASCGASSARSVRRCARTIIRRTARSRTRAGCRSSSTRATCPSCRSRGRPSRSSSTRRASKACTCAWGTSPAAASAGPTGARISAPKCSA